MFRSSPFARSWLDAIEARWPEARRRAGPIALTVVFEIGLLLVLLSLGTGGGRNQHRGEIVTTFQAARDETPAPDEPQSKPRAATPPQPAKPRQAEPPSALPTPPPIALPRKGKAPPVAPPVPAAETPPNPTQSKIRAVIRSDMAGAPGPPDTGTPGDSKRLAGTGPNGEPLYAAQWYREPYEDELRGYLSLADGPGWALINCQTEPEYRVDHCVLVDEWPDRSNMGRAVLAAAWQFRVRPPRVGGRSMVGEWVRIRIDYDIRRE